MKKFKGLLLGLLLVFAIVVTACSSNGVGNSVGTAIDGNEVDIENAAVNLVKNQKEVGYGLINVETLNGWVKEKKTMIIIDTMPADNFKKGHIPGAVNAELPKKYDELTEDQKAAYLKLLGTDKEATIVVYCGYTSCGRSHVGAKIAMDAGYKNVYRLPGGIVAWENAKYEVEK